MTRYILAALTAMTISPAAYGTENIQAPGEVKAVTLYRGQALVTRVVPVDAPEGAVQLTVENLPDAVVGESLFANAGQDIQIRAVRYQTTAIGEAPEKEVKELDDNIASLEKQIRENRNTQELISTKRSYLDKLESFVTPTTNIEMSKGVLNAETLTTVTSMIFDQRTALSQEHLELAEAEKVLQKELSLLNRKRSELARTHSQTLRQAVIFLDKRGKDKSRLTLNYLVRNASWSPTYNARGKSESPKVLLEVGALVQQTSGEDWNSIDLTLSTAGAQLVADGPNLAPLKLHLASGPQAYEGVESLSLRLKSAGEKLRGNQIAQREMANRSGQYEIQWGMNTAVQEMQQIELSVNPQDIQIVRRKLKEETSGLAASYAINGKVSLASRHDNQMVQIAKLDLPATFFYEATPLLTEEVHRYAELTNDSDISLLQGNVGAYLDNQFVGTGVLPMVARGQKVTVGFGTNPQLRAWREFVSKESKDQLLGSKKQVTYKYRLVLDNYAEYEADVRLMDRIPVETEDITVTLGQPKTPLSTDLHYTRVYRPQGILRWDITVPAKSSRESASIVEYGFELKFDAKLHITATPPPEPAEKQRIEFEDMMEQRLYSH